MKIAENEIHIWFTYDEEINPDFALNNYVHIVLMPVYHRPLQSNLNWCTKILDHYNFLAVSDAPADEETADEEKRNTWRVEEYASVSEAGAQAPKPNLSAYECLFKISFILPLLITNYYFYR